LASWLTVSDGHDQQNFIKTWQHKEYYDTAIEAIEELSSLLPALECYASNQHVAEVIAHAKKKIAQAEANIPLAQVKFEAEPLKDQVSKTQQQLYVRCTSRDVAFVCHQSSLTSL
jgi:hypothetical protein